MVKEQNFFQALTSTSSFVVKSHRPIRYLRDNHQQRAVQVAAENSNVHRQKDAVIDARKRHKLKDM